MGTAPQALQRLEVGASRQCPVTESPQDRSGRTPPHATHQVSLEVRQGLELPAGALTTLLWEGPVSLLAGEMLGRRSYGCWV